MDGIQILKLALINSQNPVQSIRREAEISVYALLTFPSELYFSMLVVFVHQWFFSCQMPRQYFLNLQKILHNLFIFEK